MSAYNVSILVLVMLAAGLLGGWANNFLFKETDPEGSYLGRSLLYGVVASFLVPLFLKTISSDLIKTVVELKRGEGIPFDLFVFAGTCLLAAVYSKTFIQGIADKILNDAKKEAKDAKQQAEEAKQVVSQVQADVESVVAKETEPETEPTSNQSADRGVAVGLSGDEKKVLNEMAYGRFTLRTRSGIAAKVGLSKETVIALLTVLVSKGLVATRSNREGKVRWVITDEGRQAVVRIAAEEGS